MIAQLRENEGALREAGAALAAVGLADMAHARRFREETRVPFPLLVDARREAYRAAHLRVAERRDLLRPRTWVRAARLALRGIRAGTPGGDPFQLGGSFVFAPGNVDRFAHVNRSFDDDASIAAILEAVRS